MLKVDEQRLKEVLDYINKPTDKFNHFLSEHNLFSDKDLERGSDIFIHCPFHKDNTPSLSFNESKGVWSCFSCGEGGNFVRLVYLYETRVNGNQYSFSSFVNGLLKRDVKMQRVLGYYSIYTQTKLSFSELQKMDKFLPNLKNSSFISYLELADILINKNASVEQIKFAILSMQQSIPAQSILASLFEIKNGSNLEYDVNEIQKGVDFIE